MSRRKRRRLPGVGKHQRDLADQRHNDQDPEQGVLNDAYAEHNEITQQIGRCWSAGAARRRAPHQAPRSAARAGHSCRPVEREQGIAIPQRHLPAASVRDVKTFHASHGKSDPTVVVDTRVEDFGNYFGKPFLHFQNRQQRSRLPEWG
ncbi:MAG: hypothetical protein V5B30_17195 [Candidatus Accumulibacter delftensis]